jgi:hypothetical protein
MRFCRKQSTAILTTTLRTITPLESARWSGSMIPCLRGITNLLGACSWYKGYEAKIGHDTQKLARQGKAAVGD